MEYHTGEEVSCKSDFVIYETPHTYLQKKKKQSSHILTYRATSTCSQHLLLEAHHRRDQEIIPSDEEIPNYISLVGKHPLLDEYCENILKMSFTQVTHSPFLPFSSH